MNTASSHDRHLSNESKQINNQMKKLVNETSLVNTTVWSLKQTVELPSFLPISIYKEYQIMRMSLC